MKESTNKLADEFADLWGSSDSPPDVFSFLREHGNASADERLAVLLVDQVRSWRNGVGHLVEEYLENYPDVASDEQFVLQLVLNEREHLRRCGKSMELDSIISRFPKLRDRLEQADQSTKDSAETVDAPLTAAVDVPKAASERTAGAPVPRPIGHFVDLTELGRGGMGVVYRARDSRLGRDVALKMILGGVHTSGAQLERFRTEAQAVAQLQHPNIVHLFEIGEHDGLPFLVLEYIDGQDLAKQLQREPQVPEKAATLVATLARAMQYAHDHQIVHRDLKPANVLLTEDGVPKISDFGLAKLLATDAGRTGTGMVLGTPSYMSPEQARGATREVGPATDQYALGAILYEVLTGRPPFLTSDPVETVMEVVNSEPIPPRRLQPIVPVDLETICLKTLHKDPQKRYPGCGELADDLERFLNNQPIVARPLGRLGHAWKWCQRNPIVATLSALSVALLLVVTVVSTVSAVTLSAKNREITKQKEDIEQQNQLIEQQVVEITEKEQVARNRADLAKDVYQTLIDELRKTVANTPQTHPMKIKLLRKAVDGMQEVATAFDETADAIPTLASATIDLGDELRSTGDSEQALQLYHRAYDLLKSRPELKAYSDASRNNLAQSYWRLASMAMQVERDLSKTLDRYREALVIYQEMRASSRGGPSGEAGWALWMREYFLAEAHARVGATLLRLGQPADAADHFRQALEIREGVLQRWDEDADVQAMDENRRTIIRSEFEKEVGRGHMAVANTLQRIGRTQEAEKHYLNCLALRKKSRQEHPDQIVFKQELSRAHGMLGDFYFHANRLDEAAVNMSTAQRLAREVAGADPDEVAYQRDLGLAHYRLGCLHLHRAELDEATQCFQECRAVRQRLTDTDTANVRRRMELMLVLAHLGEVVQAVDLADEFMAAENVDNEMRLDVARCLTQCSLHDTTAADVEQLTERALDAIEQAIQAGYQDAYYLQHEPDLAPLGRTERFARLVETAAPVPSAQ